MKKLNPNWLTEGLLDLEYKKYVLLAYLQHVGEHFNETKLYPFLNDLVFHYNNLIQLRNRKEMAVQAFPQKISRIDLENFKLEYERLIEDDDCLDVIKNILDFAIPRMQDQLQEGKEIYEFVEEQMSIYPLGVIPLNKELGYLFIREVNAAETIIYEYNITLFENSTEPYRGINTVFVERCATSITRTLEKIKLDLISRKRDLPNPATFVIESKIALPHTETLMPVAKRTFVRYIASQAA